MTNAGEEAEKGTPKTLWSACKLAILEKQFGVSSKSQKQTFLMTEPSHFWASIQRK